MSARNMHNADGSRVIEGMDEIRSEMMAEEGMAEAITRVTAGIRGRDPELYQLRYAVEITDNGWTSPDAWGKTELRFFSIDQVTAQAWILLQLDQRVIEGDMREGVQRIWVTSGSGDYIIWRRNHQESGAMNRRLKYRLVKISKLADAV